MSTTRVEPRERSFEAIHCALSIRSPGPGVVLVTLSGRDVGELGTAPFAELERYLAEGSFQLFIDARAGRSASIDVSGAWAQWLRAHRGSLVQVSMLTGSRFIELSADFVRRFAGLEDLMRLYTDAPAFEAALKEAPLAPKRPPA